MEIWGNNKDDFYKIDYLNSSTQGQTYFDEAVKSNE